MIKILVSGPRAGCLPFFILIVGPSDGELEESLSLSVLWSIDSRVRERGLVRVTDEVLFFVCGDLSEKKKQQQLLTTSVNRQGNDHHSLGQRGSYRSTHVLLN